MSLEFCLSSQNSVISLKKLVFIIWFQIQICFLFNKRLCFLCQQLSSRKLNIFGHQSDHFKNVFIYTTLALQTATFCFNNSLYTVLYLVIYFISAIPLIAIAQCHLIFNFFFIISRDFPWQFYFSTNRIIAKLCERVSRTCHVISLTYSDMQTIYVMWSTSD